MWTREDEQTPIDLKLTSMSGLEVSGDVQLPPDGMGCTLPLAVRWFRGLLLGSVIASYVGGFDFGVEGLNFHPVVACYS
jgi:hypothetical protein